MGNIYCDVCEQSYLDYNGHIKTKKHITNLHYKGQGLTLDKIQEIKHDILRQQWRDATNRYRDNHKSQIYQ